MRFHSTLLCMFALLAFSTAVNAGGDSDGDGILDSVDNCPVTVNPAQEDLDAVLGDLRSRAVVGLVSSNEATA